MIKQTISIFLSEVDDREARFVVDGVDTRSRRDLELAVTYKLPRRHVTDVLPLDDRIIFGLPEDLRLDML